MPIENNNHAAALSEAMANAAAEGARSTVMVDARRRFPASGVVIKNNLVLTFMGRLGHYIHRLSPVLYEKIMTRQFRQELDTGE